MFPIRKKAADLSLSEDRNLLESPKQKYYTEEETAIGDGGNQTTGKDGKDGKFVWDTDLLKNTSKSGTFPACFNMANSIIGSGMIGTPYAILKCGVGLGAMLLVGVGILTDYSVNILIKAGIYSGEGTYQGIMRKAFGIPGYVIITIMQFTYPYLAMVSYNIIIGDTLTKVILRFGGDAIENTIIADRRFVIFLANLLVTVPLSMYKNVAKFAKFAGVSLFMIMFVVAVIVYRLVDYTVKETIPSTPHDWIFANSEFVRGVSIMAFAYLCHHNSFLIYDSLKNKTEKGWARVTHTSVAFVVLAMLIFCMCGYATFRSFTQGDVLENFCVTDDVANVARIIYSVNIMLTYPVECFVVREVIETAVFYNKQPGPLWRHIVLTLAICGTTLAISLITDCVSIVLELDGALMASPMIFILPALCIMKLRPLSDRTWYSDFLPVTSILLGLIFMLIGLVQAVMQIIEGIECSHGDDMAYCTIPVANGSGLLNYTYRGY